jgi:hypothetical protein
MHRPLEPILAVLTLALPLAIAPRAAAEQSGAQATLSPPAEAKTADASDAQGSSTGIADALFPPASSEEKSESPARESLPAKQPSPQRLPAKRQRGAAETLPPTAPQPERPGEVQGGFPPLPPDPYAERHDPLPPLEEELWLHGGSYLYQPEGDRLGWPEDKEHAHYDLLRLPENWQKPQPLQAFSNFLGPDPIQPDPLFHWIGPGGYVWEPRFVGYGAYQLFAFGIEADSRDQVAVGHQLFLDLDLRLTGTERFHVQFRPLGKKNTGGSYYQFTDPAGYVNNGTGEPQRYWFEGELASMLGAYVNPFAVRDVHVLAGKFPFALHNSLLINDEILGVAINKNTLFAGTTSNINVQTFLGFNDVDTFNNAGGQAYGVNAFIDYRRTFYVLTYAFSRNKRDDRRDAHYTAASVTRLFGPLTLAGRALVKIGDRAGMGSGELFVLESNYTRVFDHKPLGVQYGVFYTNTFLATKGWSSLGGANFNRLQAAFAVNPLVRIAAGLPTAGTWGIAGGVQLFRRHEDESIIPEFAFEAPQGVPVWGVGMRYLRKTGRRTFFQAFAVANFSPQKRFTRDGLFLCETIVF